MYKNINNQLNTFSSFEQFYLKIKRNRWFWLFSIFCRLTLAYAFIVAGMVKIIGERFASGLSTIHPMGTYLEALHHTGYYYSFIGIAQVIAAILLIIPRTVIIGALLYFPIIVNIWLLSYAVRFEGSIVTSPLMVLANLYLLVWHYDRLRYSTKFPLLFFTGVIITVALTIVFTRFGYDAMPRNSLSDCKKQFMDSISEAVGCDFCECVHKEGKDLNECLREFENAKNQLEK